MTQDFSKPEFGTGQIFTGRTGSLPDAKPGQNATSAESDDSAKGPATDASQSFDYEECTEGGVLVALLLPAVQAAREGAPSDTAEHSLLNSDSFAFLPHLEGTHENDPREDNGGTTYPAGVTGDAFHFRALVSGETTGPLLCLAQENEGPEHPDQSISNDQATSDLAMASLTDSIIFA